MNRSDLVTTIAERIGDKKKARQAVDALVESITEAVARGEKVAVSGLGTFERAYRAASTDEDVLIGVTVPKFVPAKGFRVLVDEAKGLGEQAIAVAAVAVAEGKKAAQVRKVATKAQAKAEKKHGDKARPTTPPAPIDEPAPAAKTTAAKTTAAKATAAKTTAAKRTPAKTTPAKTTPAKTTAAKTTAAKTTAAKTTAAKTTAAKTTAAKTTAAKSTAARRPAVRATPVPPTSTAVTSAS